MQLKDNGPTYIFIGLVLAVTLLSIGGTFHEEPSDEQSHYTTLGLKRMSKPNEIDVAIAKLKKVSHRETG